MTSRNLSREDLLADRQGRTFADVVNDPDQPFDVVLEFFNNEERQQRMEDSEIHHDRAPLAGVVRELEALPALDRFFSSAEPRRAKRLRQAIGVLVRIIMEHRGWKKTGKKGSLGVRAAVQRGSDKPGAYHNTGGLAFWFLRAERYERADGMPYRSVRDRDQDVRSAAASRPKANYRAPSSRTNHRRHQ